jgi:hypothetical protein
MGWFSPTLCSIVAAFELVERRDIVWKINLEQTVGTYKNNLN